MNRPSLRATLAVALCAAGAAQAHPGHGINAADSLLHLLEAEHVLPLLAVLAIGYAVVRQRARRRADERDRRDRSDDGR